MRKDLPPETCARFVVCVEIGGHKSLALGVRVRDGAGERR
jgi:hypothetical protein